MANFDALLDMNAADVKRPPALPQGTYLAQIVQNEGIAFSEKKKTPFTRYNVVPIQGLEDVDGAALDGIDLSKKKLRLDFYLTEDALWRLTDFFVKCGLVTEGQTSRALIPQAVGCTVKIYVIQTPNTRNPEEPPFNEIASVMSAAE